MYNFRCGVDVSIGKEVSRRIPCLYRMFLEILNIPLDIALDDNEKPRYGVNERYIYIGENIRDETIREMSTWLQRMLLQKTKKRYMK